MKYIVIPLLKGKYISEIEPFKTKGLDTDSIYIKEITGCGITQYAIRDFKENLIEILPNVPVIEGKQAEHNKKFPDKKILGVYKGVDVDDILEYLASDVEYKKILTTPEGFIYKVLKAFDNLNDLYNNFFLLYDECERIITDVDYRGDIAAPIDDFFKFKRKAMVSATVLPFSDERFKNFKYYKIEPQYNYSKPCKVIATNSVVTSLDKYLKKLKSDHVCVFFNSIIGIYSVIQALNIESNSKVFCAQESVAKLLVKGYKNASSNFNVKDLVKYNFFSSRYFSALDMKVKYKPDIVMLTDVVFAEHSMLDPHTECIQIAGRFRNGINSLTHITNFNNELESMSHDDSQTYLKGCFVIYEGFKQSYDREKNKGGRDMLKKAIDNSPAAAFFVNNKVNTFMVDNFINEERVKGYYQEFEQLKAAYKNKKRYFKSKFKTDECALSDQSLFKLSQRQSKKEKAMIVYGLFESWRSRVNKFVFPPDELKNTLISNYPVVWQAHLYLDKGIVYETDFVTSKLISAIEKAKRIDKLRFLAIKVYEILMITPVMKKPILKINYKKYTTMKGLLHEWAPAQ